MKCESCKGLIWEYLLSHSNSCASQVASALSVDKSYCQTILRWLLSQGCIEHIGGTGHSNDPRRFSAKADNPPPLPDIQKVRAKRKRKFSKGYEQKLWNNMKIEQVFSIKSITSTLDIKESTANRFVKKLQKAGYLVRVINSRRVASNEFNYRYRLIKDTGRLAPLSRRNGLWDLNEQKFYPFGHRSQPKEVMHDMVG
ncbi:hypothetical protein VCSRO12_0209 [Vibrio cholerae]|uniref:hypothetical protein n=1 Tax=Vibrio cholerae TaxID=666 RepID=UPI000E6BBF7C|nr:hypothetical protein [Vibrio cholerae]EGR1044235.1 hypothetical protein [Vibrio cholerae]EGR1111434.1 hypothetical protein [Vibrio cholerae]EGR2081477.1 hypothetical protein [Vibrio cholerae]EJI2329165.1 hypothetical protein [Vibrio cholerae]EKF9080188.1 hypothetical protein [Vibrio cholerae]